MPRIAHDSTCNQPDCPHPQRSRGLCENHYRRQLRVSRTPKDPEIARAARRASAEKARTVIQDRTRDRLAELQWMLDGGEWPPRACERLDWSLSAALKAAQNYGAPALVAVLDKHKREQMAA